MTIQDLLFIVTKVINSPELITFSSEDTLQCNINDLYFGINIRCNGYEVVLLLNDQSEVSFYLSESDKKTFYELFNMARKSATDYNYKKLINSLDTYENTGNNINYKQSN